MSSRADQSFEVRAILSAVARQSRVLLLLGLVTAAVTAVVLSLTRRRYEGTMVLVPVQGSRASGGLAGAASFLGGTLRQDRDRVTEARDPWPPPPGGSANPEIKVVTKRQPTPEEWTALRFAWRVCAHVKSNTIVFTTGDRSLAIGAGQMSRVDAVKVAVNKAGGWKGGDAAVFMGVEPRRSGPRSAPVAHQPRRQR